MESAKYHKVKLQLGWPTLNGEAIQGAPCICCFEGEPDDITGNIEDAIEEGCKDPSQITGYVGFVYSGEYKHNSQNDNTLRVKTERWVPMDDTILSFEILEAIPEYRIKIV